MLQSYFTLFVLGDSSHYNSIDFVGVFSNPRRPSCATIVRSYFRKVALQNTRSLYSEFQSLQVLQGCCMQKLHIEMPLLVLNISKTKMKFTAKVCVLSVQRKHSLYAEILQKLAN